MTKKNIVYKATNLINNKCYIGQTTDTLDNRIKRHLTKSKKTNNYFHNAIKKHGIDNFKWEILYECDSKEILNLMETFKIIIEHSHYTENGYNMTWGGEGTFGYKHTEKSKKKIGENSRKRIRTDESKRKNGDSHRGKVISDITRQKLREINTGKTLSNETKQKMSESHKGKVFSEETKKKISESKIGKKRPKNLIEKLKNMNIKYNNKIISDVHKMLMKGMTQKEIGKKLNLAQSTIGTWIKKFNI